MAAAVLSGCHKEKEFTPVKAPVLANRLAIIQERDSLAQLLVKPGDTQTVYVFIAIDAQGVVHQPEVKPAPPDPKLEQAALHVVRDMRFQPAQQDGHAKAVLMKVPVRFARPAP
jgi:TonB family protein